MTKKSKTTKQNSLKIIVNKNESYYLYDDGVFYSQQSDKNQNALDIPQWLFEFRDFVLKNYKKMKYQLL